MSILRTTARTLLASAFIAGGVDAIRNPGPKAEQASGVIDAVSDRVDGVPQDKTQVIRTTGAVQVLGGLGLATGNFRRTSATALAGTLVPTTAATHRFWEEKDPAERKNQMQHLLKNVALFGGLLITAMDHEGQPGPAWRAQHAVEHANLTAEHAGEIASLTRDLARARTEAKAAQARAAVATSTRSAAEKKGRVAGAINQAKRDTHVIGTIAETKGRVAGTVNQARRDAKLGAKIAGKAKNAATAVGRGVSSGASTLAGAVTP